MTDCLGGLQVDDKFEPGRLLDGNIGRLGALQHFNDYASALTVRFHEAGSIANESSVLRVFGPLVYRRQAKRCDVPNKIRCIDRKHRRRQKIDRLSARYLDITDRRDDVGALGDASNQSLDATAASRVFSS